MEGGGGFRGYHKLSNATTSGPKLSLPDLEMKLSESNNGDNQTPTPQEDNECTVREQDRFMPIANVIRIMRRTLPPHAKISDDAKETIQECVSEYISFITSEANERCQLEQRKTITAEDVLFAMSKLGFDDYIEPLTLYLHRFREMDGERIVIKGDQFGKKPVDFGAQAFVPAFHVGYQHRFFGGAAMDGSNAGPSQAAVAIVNHVANETEHYDNQRLI